jgi:hypothetical protein
MMTGAARWSVKSRLDRDFYFTACGFKPTNAGLIALERRRLACLHATLAVSADRHTR